jgi:uncharacterized membrane protein
MRSRSPRSDDQPPAQRERSEDREIAESTVVVAATPSRVHALFSDYGALASWLPSLRRAKRVGASTVLWDAELVGHQVVWESRIVRDVPARRIAWKSVARGGCDAELELEPVGPERTRIRLVLRYRARGLRGWLVARLGLVDRAIGDDLAFLARALARSGGPPGAAPTGEADAPAVQRVA